ncbi:MAG: aldehyde dehydrogenase family protein [Candidatus Omnitrophica bacterium]|nr:aldehyde dehydrogenase family protein [Candidatus Omnitrophota bacterium]
MNVNKKREIINPCNEKVIAQVPEAALDDLERAVSSARNAFDNGPWPKMSPKERAACLFKIAEGIRENASKLIEIESLNTGKPIKETTFMDIPSAAQVFEDAANLSQEWLKDEEIKLPAEARSALTRQPIGVVGLIVPWNYPLLIACWKTAFALAAGNTIVLKPASLTPLSALELGRIIEAAGLPKGVFNIVTGAGSTVGAALAAHKAVDMISFTGSNEVGKEIMKLASANTKKLVMELGGKSAAVVLDDCDIETVSSGLLCGIFLNQGQMCTAMSRLLIDKKIADKFLDAFVSKAKALKLGDGLDPETQMGPLISKEQRKKVMSFVERAEKQGAHLVCGGKIPADLKQGFFFEPTVFADVRPEMDIFQEEVFGPVTGVSTFSSLDEAAGLANNSAFGLAASIWARDLTKAQRLAGQINAGTVWINTYGMFYPQAPYGGFKQSGFGKELGREGLLEYTNLKHINTDLSGRPLVANWFSV